MRTEQRPKYVQVIEQLSQRIAAKEWKAGEPMPSEMSLAEHYGVSLGTVRKAISELAMQNLLAREQGRGTFVAKHNSARALRHYFRLVNEDGSHDLPEAQVVRRSEGIANQTEVERLQLRAGAKVLRYVRKRYFGDSTIVSERIVLPASRFPNHRHNPIVDLPVLVYHFYSEQHGVLVTAAEERLRAVRPDAIDRELLNILDDEPLLQVDRVALDISNIPVEWRLSHCLTAHHYYLNRFS